MEKFSSSSSLSRITETPQTLLLLPFTQSSLLLHIYSGKIPTASFRFLPLQYQSLSFYLNFAHPYLLLSVSFLSIPPPEIRRPYFWNSICKGFTFSSHSDKPSWTSFSIIQKQKTKTTNTKVSLENNHHHITPILHLLITSASWLSRSKSGQQQEFHYVSKIKNSAKTNTHVAHQ